jgi:hypothetical protein
MFVDNKIANVYAGADLYMDDSDDLQSLGILYESNGDALARESSPIRLPDPPATAVLVGSTMASQPGM